MGVEFEGDTVEDLREQFIKDSLNPKDPNERWMTVKWSDTPSFVAARGQQIETVVFVLREHQIRQSEGKPWVGVRTYITVVVIQPKENRSGFWGKPYSEECGPGPVMCPLEFLEMAPCPDHEFAREWRERVRWFWRQVEQMDREHKRQQNPLNN
jgi:hypothetical protein